MRTVPLLIAALFGAVSAFAQVPDLDLPDAPDSTSEPAKRGTLEVEYVGNTAFTAAELRNGTEQQYAGVESFGLNPASAYDMAYFLEVFYRMHGYSQVEVEEAITGPWSLRLRINEGPLTRLGTITFQGNEAHSHEDLMNYLLGPLRERFPRIRSDADLPFVEALIGEGADLIRRLYGAEGFLDAEVEPPGFTFEKDFTVGNVELTIHEGLQYRFGEIVIVGSTIFSEEELLAAIHDDVEAPFTDGRMASAARRIEDYYKTRGYYEANVSVDATPPDQEDGRVGVTFHVEPGALYTFDGVTVTGVRDLPPDFIEKRLRSLRGKRYDPALIDKKFRELIGTGLFQTLRIQPEPVPGDELRLDVEIVEAKSKEVGFGIGYGTFVGGILTVTYTDLNLFGSGRSFTSKAEVTQRGYNGEAIYSNPWLFDTDWQFKARLFAETITLEGYSKNELGFRPSLARQLTDHWRAEVFVIGKTLDIYDVLIEPESLVGRTRYSVAAIGISQMVDYRNDPALPTSGFLASTSFDVAPNGVGDVAFVRGVAQASLYVPVTSKTTLAFGARGGIISPLSAEGLPIDERFFNGGASSVRSFPELKLGPKDHAGWPLGGQTYTVFNVEYGFPIWQELRGALFFDAGNVISNARDFGFEGMRYAIGGGLRYNLPVGPIRFDYGFNPDRQTGEPQGAFHFSVGLAF